MASLGIAAVQPGALGRVDRRLQALGCVDLDMVRPRGWLDKIASWLPAGRMLRPVPAPAPVEELIRRLPTGFWRIRRDTARALAALFHASAPRVVLEFGSGTSTILFAALCAAAGHGQRVVSIEEDDRYAAETRARLQEHGLGDHATVITAPIVAGTIGGWRGMLYAVDPEVMRQALGGERAGMVFIDGPAKRLGRPDDCRFGTLPLARTWAAERALFVADDALRARDLAIVRNWRRLPFVEVAGIILVGRGLAAGSLRGPKPGP